MNAVPCLVIYLTRAMYYKMYIKNKNLKTEVGITIKVSKQVTSSNQTQEIYPVLATVITQSQMHVQIKHSLAHLRDVIPTLTGIKYICKHTSQSIKDSITLIYIRKHVYVHW